MMAVAEYVNWDTFWNEMQKHEDRIRELERDVRNLQDKVGV
jgi:polyhydroxyalkanoate synthesis regulator phasin